ncbi:MAG: AAA family ATPase [Bradymonadaceae bacterium]
MPADVSTESPSSPVASDADASIDQLGELRANIESVFRGKADVVRHTVACLVARGHLLLEDVPGVGKTTLALAVARSLGLSFERIQFTSDLLPSDIIGVTVYSKETDSFEFRPGPLFSNVVLADEINRTTPRTQSALLEAMNNRSVSVDDVTRPLPDLFTVIATQNPVEHHGTYPLPESQLDRFLMRLSIGYPGREVERELLTERGLGQPVEELEPVVGVDEFADLQRRAADARVDDSIVDYVLEVVERTRRDGRLRIGVSTRGGLALMRAARALALVEGRTYVVPEDVRELFLPCFSHRVALEEDASGARREEAAMVIEEIASEVEPPT